jgi:hypothetical protein
MSAALDAVIRAWLVVAAWVRLHRAPALHRLAHIGRPMAFVRAALVPAGRMVALAIALLPRKHRREAAIAYVACKALVAIDETDARRQISAAVRYLTGESADPPRIACALGTTQANALQALLAARLPLLRAAIKGLPGDAARRCCAIVERIGDAMIHARAVRQCGADHVFGEAVLAAARLTVPTMRAPGFACNAAGRALRLADEVRRARGDERGLVLYQAVQTLPTVPRLLRWIPASVEGGTRAAATLIAATTYRFYLRELGAEVPRRLRHPLRAALTAAWSRRAYVATVDAIEDGLHDALEGLDALAAPALLDHIDAAATRAVLALGAPGVGAARRLVVRARRHAHAAPR